MRSTLLVLSAVLLISSCASAAFRPPAVPLVVNNPWLSIWSMGDNLYDTWPQHGPSMDIIGLCGMIRVDGNPRRWMGNPGEVTVEPFTQQSVTVRPRSTIYEFEDLGVHLTVKFMSAAFPQDLELLSRPVTYLNFEVRSVDGKDHTVELYYDNTGEMGVSKNDQQVTWDRFNAGNQLSCMNIGADQQNPLKDLSDRVSWGYFVVCHEVATFQSAAASSTVARQAFVKQGQVPFSDDTNKPRQVQDNWPVLSFFTSATVGQAAVNKQLILAFDDIEVADFFGEKFVPYWNRHNEGVKSLLINASRDYNDLNFRVARADNALESAAFARGGEKYRDLISLIYRQALGGCNLGYGQDSQRVWYWLKEISSCSCFQTADVIYPFAPILLYENPTLLYKTIEPLLVYANNETRIKYNLAWAPHHLGRYPVADITPDHQEQMPVEETANLLIMLADIAFTTQNTDFVAPRFWSLLESWAKYLKDTTVDPGDQLCTDDFEGPSPHNANLALKGMEGLAAYSVLMKIKGETQQAASYLQLAQEYATKWVGLAVDSTKDHYKLQYNKPSSWSQKYNIWWQKRWELPVFQDADLEKEFAYYATKLNKYGLPLDSRATFTKDDWSMWVASVSPNSLFESIVSATWNFANETPDRFALTDWYDTVSAKRTGFHCRPVVGGFFAPMLSKASFPVSSIE